MNLILRAYRNEGVFVGLDSTIELDLQYYIEMVLPKS